MDKYEEIRSVGKGSFGDVILVRRKKDDRQFVLKKMSVGKTEKEREATQLEIQLLQNLEHPGVVEYIESFTMPKSSILCIVMAFCEGGDLTNFMKKKRSVLLTEKEIMDYLVQMLLALHYMHDRNILHRDLKTQNVFLKNGFLKLGDFGISKVLDNSMDFAQTCIGTPYYMSPELFKNQPYNFKTDVWSLGCVLYELATYKHAFDSNSLNGLAGKIVKGIYPPISPNYSKNLRGLIASMLAVKPADRPSMEDILKKPFIKSRVEVFVQTLFKSHREMQANSAQPINLPKELENLKKQMKSLGWEDIIQSITAPLSSISEVPPVKEKENLRDKYQEQQSKLAEEEQQRNNLEMALQRLRDESKWRAQQRVEQQNRQAKAGVNLNIQPIAKIGSKVEPPKIEPKVDKLPLNVAVPKPAASNSAAKQIAAAISVAKKPAVPVVPKKPVGPTVSSNPLQVEIKRREDDYRKKLEEDSKRVADLEAWEAEKKKKLKEERERSRKLQQAAADEAERKALEDRKKKEFEAYQNQLEDRMNKEQEELARIRQQRERLQNKLEAMEAERQSLQFAPNLQSGANSASAGKLPDAFKLNKQPANIQVPQNNISASSNSPNVLKSPEYDVMSPKDRVLFEKEKRRKAEEEKRKQDLEAARNEYASHRVAAAENNKALYAVSGYDSKSKPTTPQKSPREVPRELDSEALDKFPGDSDAEDYEDENMAELEDQLMQYTLKVDQMRQSLRETEFQLELHNDDPYEEEFEEEPEPTEEYEEDPEFAVSLSERYSKLREFCQHGLGRERFNIAYDRFKNLRDNSGVQDDVSEMELLIDIIGEEDARTFFKPLDQLYFIEINFM